MDKNCQICFSELSKWKQKTEIGKTGGAWEVGLDVQNFCRTSQGQFAFDRQERDDRDLEQLD